VLSELNKGDRTN